MTETRTRRLYIALERGALLEDSPRFCTVAAFGVDTEFCAAYGIDIPETLQGEALEVAEDLAMQQAAFLSLWADADSLPEQRRRIVAVAEVPAVSGGLPLLGKSAGDCAEFALPGLWQLVGPLELSQVISFHLDEPGSAGAVLVKEFGEVLENPAELLWFDASEFSLVRDFLRQEAP